MKKLILISILASIFCFSFSQQKEFVLNEALQEMGFRDTVIIVEGKAFEAVLSSTGILKTERVSKKTGNHYWQYLGRLTDYSFEGKQVLSNPDMTQFWILGLTKNGTIKKLYLSEAY